MSALSLRELKEFKSRLNNKNVLSDFVLLNYSNYLNDFALINKDINFYYQNAFGLDIPAFKAVNLSELIEKHETKRLDRNSIISSSGKYHLLKDDLQNFHIKLANDIHGFSLKINDPLNSPGFQYRREIRLCNPVIRRCFQFICLFKKIQINNGNYS